MGLARNHYAGRTFIQPTTYQREFGVRMKLHPIREIIRDKRIILVDDSLVRGTTSKTIVKLLKENGAREVRVIGFIDSLRKISAVGLENGKSRAHRVFVHL